MKKKLIPVLAVAMSVALASCSSEKVEEGKEKVRKNIENDIDKISSALDSYIDDETALSLITDAPTDTTPKDPTPTTTADESEKVTQASDSTASPAPADFLRTSPSPSTIWPGMPTMRAFLQNIRSP